MDAWIEITAPSKSPVMVAVASFMDAWIEIVLGDPSLLHFFVASFMDAWIEMLHLFLSQHPQSRRILYGCVD